MSSIGEFALMLAVGCAAEPDLDAGASTDAPTDSADTSGPADGLGDGRDDGAGGRSSSETDDGAQTGDGDPTTGDGPACDAVEPIAVSPGCAADARTALALSCGQEVTILAVAAYEADLAEPDATAEQVQAYLNEPGFEGRWSVAERVAELTGQRVQVRFVTELVHLPRTRAEYEADSNLQWHVDAVAALDQRDFDFSQLSTLPDGSHYPMFSISLGEFWATPHAGFFLDAKGHQFAGYSLTYYEPGYDVGVITHELGHALFRWGEYYGVSPNAGLGRWGIMSHGFSSPYNPFLRQCRGWGQFHDLDPLTPHGTRIELPADADVVLRYRTAERPSEYFLIEARTHSPRYPDLPDEGLLIWHIDEAMAWQMGGLTPDMHNRVSIEQADGLFGVETDPNDFGGRGDAFSASGVDAFGDRTTPSSRWWDDSPSGLEVSEVSTVGASMSFVLGPAGSANGTTVSLMACADVDVCL